MELFPGGHRRFDRTVFVIQLHVFQRERRHDAAVQRRQRHGAVHPEEPQQRGEQHVHPAHHAAHLGQRRRNAVHDDLVEVGAPVRQRERHQPHDREDDETGDQRREGARHRSRHAVRQADHPVAPHDESKHLGHHQPDHHTGNDVGAAQPVGAHRIGLADVKRRDGHKGRHRQQCRSQRIDLALFGQRHADKERRHQGHDPQRTVVNAAADALQPVQRLDGGGIQAHAQRIEERSFAEAQEHVVDQHEHRPGQGQRHQADKAVLDGVDVGLLTDFYGERQDNLLERGNEGIHGGLLLLIGFLDGGHCGLQHPQPIDLAVQQRIDDFNRFVGQLFLHFRQGVGDLRPQQDQIRFNAFLRGQRLRIGGDDHRYFVFFGLRLHF